MGPRAERAQCATEVTSIAVHPSAVGDGELIGQALAANEEVGGVVPQGVSAGDENRVARSGTSGADLTLCVVDPATVGDCETIAVAVDADRQKAFVVPNGVTADENGIAKAPVSNQARPAFQPGTIGQIDLVTTSGVAHVKVEIVAPHRGGSANVDDVFGIVGPAELRVQVHRGGCVNDVRTAQHVPNAGLAAAVKKHEVAANRKGRTVQGGQCSEMKEFGIRRRAVIDKVELVHDGIAANHRVIMVGALAGRNLSATQGVGDDQCAIGVIEPAICPGASSDHQFLVEKPGRISDGTRHRSV